MSNLVEEIIKGRKTFFIAPDKSLIPESYLEEYLTLGYECYFIDNDIFLPLEKKVEVILSIFNDSILFFNIDFPLQNTNWLRLITNVKQRHPKALFGIIYAKRQTQHERAIIEHTYLYTLGLQCGCIQLEYQKKENFGIIEKALFANQAMGRRKSVRAICTGGCSFKITDSSGQALNGRLNDISVSHFSVSFPIGQFEVKEFEKLIDVQLTVHGTHFRSDAVMCMKRAIDGKELFVFAFVTKNGGSGLDPLNRQIVTPKIYEILSDNCQTLLTKLFQTTNQNQSKYTSIIPEPSPDQLTKENIFN